MTSLHPRSAGGRHEWAVDEDQPRRLFRIHPREPPDAKPLWYYRFDDQKQPVKSRTQLHDFFSYYWFTVPHIPPGTYTLTFQVADETSPDRRRVTSKSHEFRVTAMPMGTP